MILMTNDVQWQGLYQAAMLELNPAELRGNIGIAQAAIRERCEELMRADYSGSSEERREIADALANLQALERSELKASRAVGSLTRQSATV